MKALFFSQIISLKNSLYFSRRNNPQNFFLGIFLVISSLIGIYVGIWKGLSFIVSLGSLGTVIIKKIIFILFFILFFMVATSFGILFYNVGFKSKETQFLLTLPFEEDQLLLYSFLKSAILAAWIPFLGLIIFFLSYSFIGKLSWVFILFMPLYIFPFLILACFFGYLATLLIIRFLGLKKVIFILIFLFLLIFFRSSFKSSPDILYFLSEEVIFLKTAQVWFLPFSWPVYGLLHLENQEYFLSFLYMVNLWSLMFFSLSVVGEFKNMFFFVYHYKILPLRKRAFSYSYIKKILEKFNFISSPLRAFIVKDIKLFMRDSTFFLQFLIFFGILFFYFLNLRRFSYHLLKPVWKNLLTFLNTFSVLCIISAISTRFIFPQWSLEGRNFWLLKLAPLSLKRIYRGKFFVASIFLLTISGVLIFISNHMLKIERFFLLTFWIVVFSALVLLLFSLSLGAYFSDFKEEHYLKAVESVGGFFTLVINFLYIFFTLFLFGTITHLHFIGRLKKIDRILCISLVVWMGVGIILSLVFKYYGIKKLESKEF